MEPALTSPPEGQPRVRSALRRLLMFFGFQLIALLGAQLVMLAVSRASTDGMRGPAVLGVALLLSAGMLGLYGLLVRFIERREPEELAPRRAVPLAAVGLLTGLLVFCLTYGVLWALGHAQWLGFTRPADLLPPLALAVLAGVGEELVFRGGIFRTLEGRWGTGIALLVSAAIFGGLHAMNPGATWVSSVAIALEAGLLLGAAYAVVRNLWLPIGVHIGWNFTEGGIFGAAVSGLQARQGLVHMPLEGPDWVTGGAFGPEASVVTVGVCLVVTAVLLAFTVRNGRWVPLPSKTPKSF